MDNVKITLNTLDDLFSKEAPFPKEMLRERVIEDMKATDLAGANPSHLKISFDDEGGGDILIKRIDPKRAQGYLVFQDERDYTSWLSETLTGPDERLVNGTRT